MTGSLTICPPMPGDSFARLQAVTVPARVFTDLPGPVRDQIRDHVVAVFLAERLGSTGYVELLREFDANKMGFIVLDTEALDRTAND